MKQADLYYFETMQMMSQAWSKFTENSSPEARIFHTKFDSAETFFFNNVSVNSKPDRVTIWDSHILAAPGVGFSLLCLERGSALGFAPRGVLNQSKSSIILKKRYLCFVSLTVE